MSSNKKEKAPKKSLTMAQHRARHGVFSTTAVIIVIAIVVAINVLVSGQNWSVDLTDNKMFTLSDKSKKMVSALADDKEIDIYFLNKENNTAMAYSSILSQYEKASKNINVEYKDLDLYPNFATKYLEDGASASANDAIVVSGDRYRYISSSDFVGTSYDSSGNMQTEINIEPKITSAIDYVTSDEVPTVYFLTGHGEAEVGSNVTAALEDDNYKVEQLSILETGGIPGDCSLLYINAPTADLDTSVIESIKAYMEDNGKLYVSLDPTAECENLFALLAEYGVQVEKGIVVETGSGYYMGQYPTYLLPTLASHDITSPISNAGLQVLAPLCKGLTTISDVTDYTVTDLLVTSSDSYAKADIESSTFEKEEGDVDGPLAVAKVVENSDGKGVVVVDGCASLSMDDIDSYVSGANTNVISNSVNYLTEQESKVSVQPTTLSDSYAVFTAFASKMVMAIGVVGIPLLLIGIGVVIWVVRKKS